MRVISRERRMVAERRWLSWTQRELCRHADSCLSINGLSTVRDDGSAVYDRRNAVAAPGYYRQMPQRTSSRPLF